MTFDKLRPYLTVPLLVLVLGFGFSLAANLLSTWHGGPVLVAGGALASLALPAAIHLWPRVPTGGAVTWAGRVWPVRRIVRAVVMTLIAVMAAVTTLVHASGLLLAHGESLLLALAYPVVTELIVTMAALALRGAEPSAQQAATRSPAGQATAPPAPAARPVTAPVRAVGSSTAARARAWIQDEHAAGREPTGADVDAALGLDGKARCGARALRQVLEQREAVS